MQGIMLVRDWASKWFAMATAGKGIRQIETVRNVVVNHILPVIGDMPLKDVCYFDCLNVLAQIPDASYSLRSKITYNMRAMFEVARRSKLIDENPCDGIRAGGKKPKEKEALSLEQTRILEEAVCGTRAETFVLLGLYTGLRREEILGLMWDSVNLSAPASLTVRRVVRWERCRPIVSDELKSRAALRTIPIPEKLTEHLRAIQRDSGYVIGGDEPLTYTQYRNLWNIVRNRMIGGKTYRKSRTERVEIDRQLGATARNSTVAYTIDFQVTPHILRHTYITRLVLSGVNVKHVQYLAGHSNPAITLKTYTHIIQSDQKSLALDIEKAFPS